MNTEAKVGILFFLGMGVALWFTLFVTDSTDTGGSYRIAFDETLGLDTGANVTYNGVRIGRVRQVVPELEVAEPVVAVYFDVESPAESILIGEQTRFTVAQGLFGGSDLAILNPGRGVAIDRVELREYRGEAPTTLNDAIKEFHDLIEENRTAMKSAVDRLPMAVENFSGMSAEIRDTVAENRENLGEMVAGIRDVAVQLRDQIDQYADLAGSMLGNIDGMAVEIRSMVEENRPDIREAVKKIPDTVGNIQDASATAAAILDENRPGIKTTVDNLAEAMPKFNAIGSDLQEGHGPNSFRGRHLG